MYAIFDMDDTLVTTADLWRDAEMHLLTSLGGERTDLFLLYCVR